MSGMRVWWQMAHVPDGVKVTNRYGETLIGSSVYYTRDIRFSWRGQYAAPFTEAGTADEECAACEALDEGGPCPCSCHLPG